MEKDDILFPSEFSMSFDILHSGIEATMEKRKPLGNLNAALQIHKIYHSLKFSDSIPGKWPFAILFGSTRTTVYY